jgi:hypothetical protein
MLLPIEFKIGRAVSYVEVNPLVKIVRLAFLAPLVPPETGALRY